MIEPTVKLFQEIERKRRELDHIVGKQAATDAAAATSGAIRDDLNDADLLIQEQRFAELYGTAAEIAGRAVRLAAIARQGMIQTEGGEHGTKTDKGSL